MVIIQVQPKCVFWDEIVIFESLLCLNNLICSLNIASSVVGNNGCCS